MPRYDFKRIETKWQAYWESHQTFKLSNDILPAKQEKLYVLDMFPYPSGAGLHVGHPEGYTATDITCRYARMRGKMVLHPMGWDAFGLPAEEHAVKTGTHPRITTLENINNFRRQLKMLGFSYDWSRELSTTDPEYYRWTQWIFLQLFDTWFDPQATWTDDRGRARHGRGRPIAELPIPEEVRARGDEAIRRHQDSFRLAYQHEAPVNWCPALGTVLANEEVIDGRSERGDHPVVRLPLRQWMFRITAYAERLLDDLDQVDWPDSIKALQHNWIGRSEGAEVDFYVGPPDQFAVWQGERQRTLFPREPGDHALRIYTTRPDTLYGATYMVLAPEHPFVARLTTPAQQGAVAAYCEKAAKKSDLDRTDLAKEKTGVFTGAYALNPVNGEPVPIWIADYVLASYGTGAIMAVPGHDDRDLEFARQYQLPIRLVVAKPDAPAVGVEGWTEPGLAVASGPYTGLPTAEFKPRITADLAQRGLGRKAVNFRLRDWLFSRQRYWGEPFPIWHELDAAGQPTGLMLTDPESALPVLLPELEDFRPTGTPEPLLAKAPDDWRFKTLHGKRYARETNTMPQWAGSCWYYLRFIDPKNSERFVDPAREKAWMPVDLYIGGAEHAVLHLLYSRFWHKVLYDRGHVSSPEPFRRLVNQGMILGEAELTGFHDADGQWVSSRDVEEGPDGGPAQIDRRTRGGVTPIRLTPEQVVKSGNDFVLADRAEIVVDSRSYKMSKSRKNVVNPDDVVQNYGADSLRLYEMFMGPLEAMKPWSMKGVEGVSRFCARVWRLLADERSDEIQLNETVQDVPPTPAQRRILHKTIQAVTHDIESLGFNTAISRMMEFVNELSQSDVRPKSVLEPFILLLSPFAPHLAEECWQLLGRGPTLAYEPWPEFDPAELVEAEVEIPVQVNGKLRGRIKIPKGADQAAVEALARSDENVASQLTGKQVVKIVFVADRMMNFVVK